MRTTAVQWLQVPFRFVPVFLVHVGSRSSRSGSGSGSGSGSSFFSFFSFLFLSFFLSFFLCRFLSDTFVFCRMRFSSDRVEYQVYPQTVLIKNLEIRGTKKEEKGHMRTTWDHQQTKTTPVASPSLMDAKEVGKQYIILTFIILINCELEHGMPDICPVLRMGCLRVLSQSKAKRQSRHHHHITGLVTFKRLVGML